MEDTATHCGHYCINYALIRLFWAAVFQIEIYERNHLYETVFFIPLRLIFAL